MSKLECHAVSLRLAPVKFCAQLLAQGAVQWGRPEVILNSRSDVREGEINREIGPLETQDAADVVPELDG